MMALMPNSRAVGNIVALVGLHVHLVARKSWSACAHGAGEVGGPPASSGRRGTRHSRVFLEATRVAVVFGLAHGFFNHAARNGGPVFGQFATHTAGKFCGKFGIGLGVGCIGMLPGGLGERAPSRASHAEYSSCGTVKGSSFQPEPRG